MLARPPYINALRLLLILVVMFTGPFALAQKEKRDNYPWISIGDIKTCKSDTFRIQAKVVDFYHCPPCPKGAICEPCIGDHVTVVDTDGSSKQRASIFTKNPDEFAKEAVYVFTLTLHDKAYPDSGANLVSFETLKK
jgi:hypothetical protein